MKKELLSRYKEMKCAIKNRLKEFEAVWDKSDKQVFSELCFCICTPQSKAVYCDKAVRGLVKNGVLYSGTERQIRSGLKAVRFPNNKATFIFEARKLFEVSGKIRIKKHIDAENIFDTREWIVKNVKGLGFKEASHFLRNIGLGEGLAILDVHILRNMLYFGVIKEAPKTITKKRYYELEEKFGSFANSLGIPMAELDILLWAKETGIIFK